MIRRRKLSGFSLLELLVVVFMIGVLATMFTLSIGITGDDHELEQEADRLRALIRLANEEATLQGREIGLRFYLDGYEFVAFFEDFVEYRDPDDSDDADQSEWSIMTRDSLLKPRRLPADLVLELEIDGRSVVLDRDDGDFDIEDSPKAYEPQVRIFSSGDISPFIVRLRRSFKNSGTVIEVKADGTVELTRDGQ